MFFLGLGGYRIYIHLLVFFNLDLHLHLHLRCYFWPWSWWIVPYTLGIEATAGTKKTPWPRQHPKPWRLPQWRPFGVGVGNNPGWAGLCFVFFFKVEIKLERRNMCRVGSNYWCDLFFLDSKKAEVFDLCTYMIGCSFIGAWHLKLRLRIVDNVESIERGGSNLVNCDATSYSFVTS